MQVSQQPSSGGQDKSVRSSSFEELHTLDSLAAMSSDQLRRIYLAGYMPQTLAALDGHPRGRMLAVVFAESRRAATALRRFAGASAFPWGGKSFRADTDTEGSGINRVHLFGRHKLFPFHTRNEASLIDGEPCVMLDYDLRDNPRVIRKIHDEVREVSAGLFLGPAMWKLSGPSSGPLGFDAKLVLWFALDTNQQAAPIGAG